MLTSQQIRQQFIDYFVEKHGHTFVPSSPVVPHGDATLMFANAGMNQFKDVFLGTGSREYRRAVNTQKCIRAGGKHNDLEDVGKDTYHHTFFEMLGNWSFGDYFKKEAIEWAWDLLTNVWDVPPERLHATYFEGDESEGLAPDDEARNLWLGVLPAERIHPGDKKDNFWEMGDTGPCGPCSEIHIDLTPGKDGGKLVNAGDPRVIEIWNLVFIQFNRDGSGKLSPLPARHVDTGMGFERITAVLQGKTSNYDTDIWSPLFEAIRDITGAAPYGGKLGDSPDAHVDTAYRVIADHIRTLTFALTDGAVPSNEGRGFVLRRILRRAVRHGWQTLDQKKPFLHRLVPTVVEAMEGAFPELRKNPKQVASIIEDEEKSFGRTLDRGIALFERAASQASGKTIGGDDAFKLHDTYGFPIDLTQVMSEERGMSVDIARYNELMTEAQGKARAGGATKVSGQALVEIVQKESPPATEFAGYDGAALECETLCRLYRIEGEGYHVLDKASAGETCVLVTGRTPFYAEAGGQVGDTGVIGDKHDNIFRVRDTQRIGEVIFHIGEVEEGAFEAGEKTALTFRVDHDRRDAIMANHTGTHILNRALRKLVNPDADQKGSLVDPDKLRFDFSHSAAVTAKQMEQVEKLVNDDIAADLPVYAGVAPVDKGRAINGLRAVFGEKYPPKVRIVSIGVPVKDLLANPDNGDWANYSIEFCGGTHLAKTGDAEGFVITQEEAVGKGVRRIIALTGHAAHKAAAEGEMLLHRVEALQGAPPQQLETEVAELLSAAEQSPLPLLLKRKILAGVAELSAKVKEQQKANARAATGNVVEQARRIADDADGQLIIAKVEGADGNTLRDAMDVIRKKKPDAALLLGAASDGKCAFIAAVPKPLIEKGLKAGDWVREVAKAAGGGGGGRPDMAQAGGKDPAKLDEALEVGRAFAASRVG